MRRFLKFAKDYPAIVGGAATLVSASMVLCSAIAAWWGITQASREVTKQIGAQREMARVQIVQQVRERFLGVQKDMFALDIFSYPDSGRAYNEIERGRIRRYWYEIVMHEYLMCNYFGKGLMGENWPLYEDLIANAMRNRFLMEELAAFRCENSPYAEDLRQNVVRAMEDIAQKHAMGAINWDALLESRRKNIEKAGQAHSGNSAAITANPGMPSTLTEE